jgi:hypothetical protein
MNQPTVLATDGYHIYEATTPVGDDIVVIRMLTDTGAYDFPLLTRHAAELGMALTDAALPVSPRQSFPWSVNSCLRSLP